MKLSYSILAAVMTLALAVSALPQRTDGVQPGFPDDRGDAIGDTTKGTPFDDAFNLPNNITKVNRIIVTSGDRIDSVQVNLSTPSGDINNIHGGTGGKTRTTLDLGPKERVNFLFVKTNGKAVTGLSFTTNEGRTVNAGKIDDSIIAKGLDDGSVSKAFGIGSQEFIGFHGTAGVLPGDEINSIGGIFGVTESGSEVVVNVNQEPIGENI